MKKILIVDDEVWICELLGLLFAQACLPLQLVITSDPVEALGLVASERFDGIITDRDMSPIMGEDIVNKARELSPDIKVIMMSGRMREHEPMLRETCRPDKCFEKPFNNDELANAVASLLGIAPHAKAA